MSERVTMALRLLGQRNHHSVTGPEHDAGNPSKWDARRCPKDSAVSARRRFVGLERETPDCFKVR